LRRIVREQERKGIYGGSQVIGLLAGILGVAERQLGEGEHGIRIRLPRGDGTVQAGNRCLRVTLEQLRQVFAMQDDLGGLADVAGRDRIAGQLTLHGARVSALDLHRGRAGGEQQQQPHRGAWRRAPPHGGINPLGLPGRRIILHYQALHR
jgi:hypothetical protein